MRTSDYEIDFERLIADISQILGAMHKTANSPKFWDRILGYWLLNFLDVAFVEWDATSNEPRQSRSVEISKHPKLEQVPRQTRRKSELLDASQHQGWRAQLFEDALNYRTGRPFFLKQPLAGSSQKSSNRDTRREIVRRFLRPIMWSIFCRQKYVLATSYLSPAANTALALRLRSLPTRWIEPAIQEASFSLELREKVRQNLFVEPGRSFEGFVRAVIAFYLPKSLVEEFADIAQCVENSNSRFPKVIFSANLHFSSDVFAHWLATRTENGSVLLISQHGGLNGQGVIPSNDEVVERKIADGYCNWGWTSSSTDVRIPAQVNVWTRRRRNFRENGRVILMSDATFRFKRRISTDSSRYKEHVLDTYDSIPEKMRCLTTVRLHRDHDRYDESHRVIWANRFPSALIDDGLSPIRNLYKTEKLFVCTTLGTTEIECFGRNIPAILSLDPVLHKVREDFSDLLNELQRVGLAHLSKESLRNFLESNVDDLGGWWTSEEVQGAVSRYMHKYGSMPARPVAHIASVLRDAARSKSSRLSDN